MVCWKEFENKDNDSPLDARVGDPEREVKFTTTGNLSIYTFNRTNQCKQRTRSGDLAAAAREVRCTVGNGWIHRS
jgi:hypothetical protein